MTDETYTIDPEILDTLPDASDLPARVNAPPGLLVERQQRLLVDCLYASWKPADGCPFVAACNVALYFSVNEPPMLPDVILAPRATLEPDYRGRRNRPFLMWDAGGMPDLVVEIVSNPDGGELDRLDKYATIAVPYYVVYDPEGHLGQQQLRVFQRQGIRYAEWTDPTSLPCLGLGLVLWEGEYQGMAGTWLRWCDEGGQLLPSGVELADRERQRAECLADKLRALGADPD